VTSRGDPYGALGLAPGASLADVKRAYRLLVKRNHPDAGEGSLERFLEIQAAYETLLQGGPTVGAGPGPAGPGATRPPGQRPAQPGRRGSRASAGSAPPGPARDGARPGRGPGDGPAGERGRRGRDPRKATLGSTTYDGAGETTEPPWDGADWYGPASGTYWTLNPKEYADPRKHGPEYLARARAARSRGPRGRPPLDQAASRGSQDGDPAVPAAAGPGPPSAPPAGTPRTGGAGTTSPRADGAIPPGDADGSTPRTAPVNGRPGLRRRLERLGAAAMRRLAPRAWRGRR
jgi:hypothetical protein